MATRAPWGAPIHTEGQGVACDIVYYEDFVGGFANEYGVFSETADRYQWLLTNTDTDTDSAEAITGLDDSTTISSVGGVIRILPNVDALDNMQFQLNGEAFKMQADSDLAFEMRIATSLYSDVRWGLGMGTTDTTFADLTESGASQVTGTEFIGFLQVAESGNVFAMQQDNSVSTGTYIDTATTIGNNTWHTYRWETFGNTITKMFIDGKRYATFKTNVPSSDAITPTFWFANDGSNDASATTNYLYVDYIYAAQRR